METFLSDIASELVVGGLAIIATALWHRWRSLDGKIGRGLMKVSPNRRAVITEADDGEIYITDRRGTRNLTKNPAIDRDSMWSPNSKWVAFMSQRSGDWDVYVVSADSGKISRLTTGKGSARPLQWNKSGDLIIDLGGSQLLVWNHEIEKRLK